MGLLGYLMKSSRGIVLASVATGVLSGVAGIALIALIQAELRSDGPSSPAMAWAFVGLCLLAALSRVAAQATMVRLGHATVTRLCLHLCRKILALPLERFERSDPGGLMAVLTQDIAIVTGALVGIPQVCINLPIVAASLVYVGWLSPLLLACGGAFLVPAIAAYMALGALAMRQLRAARAAQDALVGHFEALIDGFRELKLHRPRREAFLDEGLEPSAAIVRDRGVAGQVFFAMAEGWSVVAFFGFIGFALFVVPAIGRIDRATLTGIVLVVLYLMSPLDVILTWFPTLGRARASMQKVAALIPTLDAEAIDADDARAIPSLGRSIEVEGLTYSYPPGPDGAFALGPVDLTLRPGEIVFLVGGNGSGKTTFVKLLVGLYAAESGTIRLDGREVRPRDLESYRQTFSVLFADGYLFRDLRGLPGENLETRANEELANLGLDGKVRVERGTFSTTDLSQGQRRRLALLAAMLEDRPVCVFDEWAANQDIHFKKYFYLELLPALRAEGKALLVISHDEGFYGVADRVLRVRDGRVFEDATAAVASDYP